MKIRISTLLATFPNHFTNDDDILVLSTKEGKIVFARSHVSKIHLGSISKVHSITDNGEERILIGSWVMFTDTEENVAEYEE